jgi:hypothetical protein
VGTEEKSEGEGQRQISENAGKTLISERSDVILRIMNNTQFYLSIGLPIIAVLASLVISLFQISGTREDIREIRADIKPLLGLKGEMAGLKGEMVALRESLAETKETLRAEMRAMHAETLTAIAGMLDRHR